MKGHILFCNETLICPKVHHARVFYSTYLLCSAYIWVQTVLLFWSTCSFILMRLTSYRDPSIKSMVILLIASIILNLK